MRSERVGGVVGQANGGVTARLVGPKLLALTIRRFDRVDALEFLVSDGVTSPLNSPPEPRASYSFPPKHDDLFQRRSLRPALDFAAFSAAITLQSLSVKN